MAIDATTVQPGEVYRIRHIRKGEFVAQVIEVRPADEGDETDTHIIIAKYDVRPGTSQEWLSVEHGKQFVRVSGLRPSLITSIEEIEGGSWLQEVRVQEEEKPQPPPPEDPKKKFIKRLLGRRK